MQYNRELELIDTEERAYLLGLFYADGYVGKNYNSSGITLEKKDLYLLEELKEIFPFFNINRNGENAFKLISGSKYLRLDLISHGILPRKTYENRFNLRFPNIDKNLHNHFIRGFFDGDGSVYKQKINNLKIELGGTCYYFISDILKYLYDNDINFYMGLRSVNENNESLNKNSNFLKKLNYYRIYSSSFIQTKKFRDLIYKDASIFMARKKELLFKEPIYKLKEEYQKRTLSKERLICPNCNSINTRYNGTRNNKIRIFCNNCNKNATIAPNSSNIIGGEDELLEN